MVTLGLGESTQKYIFILDSSREDLLSHRQYVHTNALTLRVALLLKLLMSAKQTCYSI